LLSTSPEAAVATMLLYWSMLQAQT